MRKQGYSVREIEYELSKSKPPNKQRVNIKFSRSYRLDREYGRYVDLSFPRGDGSNGATSTVHKGFKITP